MLDEFHAAPTRNRATQILERHATIVDDEMTRGRAPSPVFLVSAPGQALVSLLIALPNEGSGAPADAEGCEPS
jgi:hypothetical protein